MFMHRVKTHVHTVLYVCVCVCSSATPQNKPCIQLLVALPKQLLHRWGPWALYVPCETHTHTENLRRSSSHFCGKILTHGEWLYSLVTLYTLFCICVCHPGWVNGPHWISGKIPWFLVLLLWWGLFSVSMHCCTSIKHRPVFWRQILLEVEEGFVFNCWTVWTHSIANCFNREHQFAGVWWLFRWRAHALVMLNIQSR